MKGLLIFSISFFIIVMLLVKCSEPEPKEPEMNYIVKAKTANRLYILETDSEIKIPFLTDERGEIIPGKENYIYVSLTGGYFIYKDQKYFYESIIGVEKDNRNATYGVDGIEIIYFKTID